MSESAGSRTSPWKVQGTFATPEQMQDAVTRLSMSGFDRADMSLPSPELLEGRETPDAGTKPVYDDTDARQGRTVGASTAASAAALAAAGITIATGGAAAPAIAAAVLAGGAAGGAVFAGHHAGDVVEQADRNDRARTGHLVLAVRALTEAKRSEAEQVLQATGATNIETI